MELNWSTFLLELMNFLVLVWILKRFLYKPVLDAIRGRKTAIEKTLSDAQTLQGQAQKLEVQYQNRLADWEHEKEGLRAGLNQELQALRERLTTDLRKAMGQEQEKERVLVARRLAEREDRAAEQGIATGVKFTARLLERIASPEVEARLVTVMLDDLPQLEPGQRHALQEAFRDPQHRVSVSSAYPLGDAQRSQLVRAFGEMTNEKVDARFCEDPSLMAGLQINCGAWDIRANLRDELRYFAEMVKHDPPQQ